MDKVAGDYRLRKKNEVPGSTDGKKCLCLIENMVLIPKISVCLFIGGKAGGRIVESPCTRYIVYYYNTLRMRSSSLISNNTYKHTRKLQSLYYTTTLTWAQNNNIFMISVPGPPRFSKSDASRYDIVSVLICT